MKIKFTKMHGLGNDYIYINCFKYKLDGVDLTNLAIKMSDRHFGVGSDGLVLIMPSKIADAKMKIFNPDGSEAQMCGNAIRCVSRYLYEAGIAQKERLSVETEGGIKTIELALENQTFSAKVNMGEPILDAKQIPTNFSKEKVIDELIYADGKEIHATCVSMGNPHCIAFVDDVNFEGFGRIGKALENHKMFPERINAELVKIIDKSHIQMRVWERGAGETLACGTGACASVVACVLNGKTERDVTVQLKGGGLNIEWRKEDNCVYMEGPAEFVFRGEWNL